MRSRPKAQLTPLLTAAAVFWFEAFGLMSLAVAVMASPLRCWGADCGPGDAYWFVRDGWAAAWVVLLLAVGIGSVVVWRATDRRPKVRARVFLAVGIAALAAIPWAMTAGLAAVFLVALWTGWPGVVFVVTSVDGLVSSRDPAARQA